VNKLGDYVSAKITILLLKGDKPHFFLDKLIDDSNNIIFSVLDQDINVVSGAKLKRTIFRAFEHTLAEILIRY
jgi:hypothetical protein